MSDAASSPTEFCVHDNGGRPFKVIMKRDTDNDKTIVSVETCSYDNQTHTCNYTAWRTFHYQQIFIGRGEYGDVNKNFSLSYGNSALLQLEGLRYVFIGVSVEEFTALDPIVDYVSTVGNSDVVYAYARDDKNRYYFFDYPFKCLDHIPDSHLAKPYDYYYSREGTAESKDLRVTTLHNRIL